jgi:hypothetical protein
VLLLLSGLRGVVWDVIVGSVMGVHGGMVMVVDLVRGLVVGYLGSWHPGWGLCGSQASGIAWGVLEPGGVSMSVCRVAGVVSRLVLETMVWWGFVGPGPFGVGGDGVAGGEEVFLGLLVEREAIPWLEYRSVKVCWDGMDL